MRPKRVTAVDKIVVDDLWGSEFSLETDSFTVHFELSPRNERISILSYSLKTVDGAVQLDRFLQRAALANGATKIWVKSCQGHALLFSQLGYRQEARIHNYFGQDEDAVIYARFFGDRHVSPNPKVNQEVLQLVNGCSQESPSGLPVEYEFKFASEDEMPELALLYSRVFSTYPNPIHDPDYLVSTLEHVLYGIIYRAGRPVAAASADINQRLQNAEMTDFATLPSARGKGLASYLLARLERELVGQGIYSFYTICRSTSPSINLVFAKQGYRYTGTLVNNCNIGGGLEDMNVYCKG